MPLTAAADRSVAFNTTNQKSRQPLLANQRPFQGSVVGWSVSGFIRALIAGDIFAGFNEKTVDVQDVSATDGVLLVNIDRGIMTVLLPLAGVTRAHVGGRANVYATADDTFTFAATGNTWVGTVIGIDSANVAVVQSIPHHLVAPGAGALGFRDLTDANVTLTTADLDKVLRMNNTAARTVNLPPAASCGGRFVTLVKDGAAAFAITLDADGAETIDGATTLATVGTANRDRLTIVSDGTRWTRVA